MKRMSEQQLNALNNRLGQALRKSRCRKGISLGAVAEMLGTDVQEILLMETRPIGIPLCELSRVIRAYGFPHEVLWALGTCSLGELAK